MTKAVIPEFLACPLLALCAFGVVAQHRPADDPNVKVIRDIAYYDGKDADPRKHKLDLYLPKEGRNLPVLMFVHGGAWRTGDRALYGKLGNTFARDGFATACISYRLSPSVKHPAHIEDVARAFAWLHRNIAQHGGDPRRIFISGHSAGGHLAALLMLNEKYLKAHKLSGKDIAGVMSLSGVYLIRGNMFEAFGTELDGWKDASPLDHARPGTPPWLIIYAQRDYPTLPQSAKSLHKALEAQKDKSELLEIPDKSHITIITSIGGAGDETTAAMLRFMREQAK